MPGDDDAPPDPPRRPRRHGGGGDGSGSGGGGSAGGDGGGNGARPGTGGSRRRPVGAGDLAVVLTTDPDWAGALEYDAFSDRITWRRPPPIVDGLPRPVVDAELSDTDLTYIAHWAAMTRNWSVAADRAHQAATIAARARVRHPARAYLDALAWDGAPRLAHWLTTYAGAAPSTTTSAIGRWTLIAAVARLYQPGCQADHVLILEGPQGVGKSNLVRALAGAWYLPQLPNLLSERPGQDLQGHWIVEIAELDAFRGIAVSRIKDFVSRTVDVYRPAYGRYAITRPRQCVFIGTTNDESYLRDATGARRFWPIAVGHIDRAALIADRDQLWAEAVADYRHGAPWYPDAAALADLAALQESRFEVDPWETTIACYLDDLAHVSVDEILQGPLHRHVADWTRADQMRVADVLKRLGWHRRVAATGRRRWYAPAAHD
jgi:predicted P-loop ATPase